MEPGPLGSEIAVGETPLLSAPRQVASKRKNPNAKHQAPRKLVWCLAIGWCFVAPKTAWGKARRGSIAAALCDRGATKPQAVFGATLRAAVLFASRFVARSSQTAEVYARRSRLAGNENSLRRNTSQLRDTTLATNPRFVTARFYPRAPSTGSRRCGAPQRARLLS